MANHSLDERERRRVVPWRALENRTSSAFTLAGLSLAASVVVPVALAAVTDWHWVSGLGLVGLGAVAVATGLLGLYPRVGARAPRLAGAGAVCAVVAGVAGVALVSMALVALVAGAALGAPLPKPTGLFAVVALSMAGGFALGFVLFGAASWRTGTPSHTAGRLLVAGGAVLLVPVAGELLRAGTGAGPPPWILFPALGLVTLDTLAVGYCLRGG